MTGNTFKELYGYNYRLGYQLAKEYNKYLLFRSGCPANGPCNFAINDKATGIKVKELGELIYNPNNLAQFYKFIIYFSNPNKLNSLTIHYIDSGKKYFIPIDSKYITGAIPEYTFDTIQIINNRLILKYQFKEANKILTKIISIDLLKYHD